MAAITETGVSYTDSYTDLFNLLLFQLLDLQLTTKVYLIFICSLVCAFPIKFALYLLLMSSTKELGSQLVLSDRNMAFSLRAGLDTMLQTA